VVPNFIDETKQIANMIFDAIRSSQGIFEISNYLEQTQKTWNNIDYFPDLTLFQNIKEMKNTKILSDELHKLKNELQSEISQKLNKKN